MPEDATVSERQPLGPKVGWGALHLFFRLGPALDREKACLAVQVACEIARADGAQVVVAAMLGHKADLGFLVIGPDFWVGRDFQDRIRAAGLEAVASYVSLTEISEYAGGIPAEMLETRLHPILPPEGKTAFCFYPMSKRRNEHHNWYTLDFDERVRLMRAHGAVGRTFHGRIVQLITGSTGLDDWEWGVTLFGVHPDDLKDCVYQMRFDEASAHYAEFGPFYTGIVSTVDDAFGVGEVQAT